MTTFIHVVGMSNTGKTTAICAAALQLQSRPQAQLLFVRPRQYVETSKVIKIIHAGKDYLVGLGSAGDNILQLKKNFDDLKQFELQHRKLDFIVCASHSKKTSGYRFVLAQMGPTDNRVEVQTKRVLTAQVAAVQSQLTQSILSHLP